MQIYRSVTYMSSIAIANRMKIFNQQKAFEKTLELFESNKNNPSVPLSSAMISQALKACTHTRDFQRGIEIHRFVSSRVKDDPYITASLVHLYMQSGKMTTAQSIFSQCKKKDSAVYGAMMKGYVTHKMFQHAIDLYRHIKNPSEINALLLFNACAQVRTTEALELVKEVSSKLSESFYMNSHALTSLVDALMQCGDVERAESIFTQSKMKSQSMYGAMMKGYIKHGMPKKTIDVFQHLKKPDEVNVAIVCNACAQLATEEALAIVKRVVSNTPSSFYSNPVPLAAVLDALMNCGDVKTAESFFHRKTTDGLSLYGVMITGYVNKGMPYKALQLFQEMGKKGLLLKEQHEQDNNDVIDSNRIIYLSVINALADFCDLTTSESVIKRIPEFFLVHPHIRNALIHMWGKVGSIEKAEQLFCAMEQEHDHIGYTAMIHAYGLNGMGRQAVDLYDRMPKEYADQKTYVSILNACSHTGLIDEARRIFHDIPNPNAQVYATMVDCLSRAALLDEAKALIEEFERTSAPSLSMHMALLSACRIHNKSHLAEEVHHRMVKLFPQAQDSITAATILFASTVASSGDMEKALSVRTRLNRSDVKKSVGLSWTVVNEKFYRFHPHDQSHPRSSEIYAEIDRMMEEVIQYGHHFDHRWVTRPLKPGETAASILRSHSEKLAIAWNFVEDPKIARIQLAQNLRMCGDCHAVTKLIALIRQCDIIVRDANRIHHFGKDGQCSCNDYF